VNESLFRFLNNLVGQNYFFDEVVLFSANFLIFSVIIALVFYVAKSKEGRGFALKNSAVILFTVLTAFVCAEVIKNQFPSSRPFVALDSVNLLFNHGGYDSFPSGHTTILSAFAFAFMFYSRPLGLIMLLVAFITGIARVISGVHWPVDILGGFFLGGFFALLMHYLYLEYQKHYGKPERKVFDIEN